MMAQGSRAAYEEYFAKYHQLAQEQMQKYRIPASITLAQGVYESGAGKSYLATHANNHFGIKTPGGWTGPYVLRNDDMPNERFRKYNSVRESYEDHSLFLKKPRYASLFNLSINDYKGWARGLKACGYATNPNYANALISIIENYNLTQYDRGNYKPSTHSKIEKQDAFYANHSVGRCNKNYYIIVQPGDNLDVIAKETGVSKRKLLRYNELPDNYLVGAGDIIWLKAKRNKADRSMRGQVYIVQEGESYYDIAQRYGMKLSAIYKLNKLSPDASPKQGDFLRLY